MITRNEGDRARRRAEGAARGLYASRGRYVPHCDRDDLEQEARIAAWQAEGRYRPGRASLATYVKERVRGVLLHYVRDMSGVPRPVWDGRREFLRWEETPVALDAWAPGTEDERIRVGDLVADGRRDPREAVEWLAVVEMLPAPLPGILYRRFWLQEDQCDIARGLGVSQMQVSRLIRRGLRLLREMVEEGGS